MPTTKTARAASDAYRSLADMLGGLEPSERVEAFHAMTRDERADFYFLATGATFAIMRDALFGTTLLVDAEAGARRMLLQDIWDACEAMTADMVRAYDDAKAPQ